ncbi:MAG: sulfatase-like hydrolase/transferase [Planctomycetes bacterium]|nr:sulfatase-like hydrolase/transferase [Planctomycetota bacterium]
MTDRRGFLKAVGLASAGLSVSKIPGGRAEAAEARSGRPNVILIMTDDQGWGQTGDYNHPAPKTPNLDKQAACGLRF